MQAQPNPNPNPRWTIFAVIAVGVVVGVVLSACGGSNDSTSSSSTSTTATSKAEATGCKQVKAPPPKSVSFKAPKQVLKPGEEATAVVKTNCGTFEIALDTKRAPKTANSFAFLAEEGFYDDLTFHRVVPGFVIQGGDPEGSGRGGPGYKFADEPVKGEYRVGAVAMANAGPDTNGSQFFICLEDLTGRLPKQYKLFGQLSSCLDAVQAIRKGDKFNSISIEELPAS